MNLFGRPGFGSVFGIRCVALAFAIALSVYRWFTPTDDPFPDGWTQARESATVRAGAFPGDRMISPVDQREMVWIPAGRFQMGSPSRESGHLSIEPSHTVTIASGFWMDRDKVTNAD